MYSFVSQLLVCFQWSYLDLRCIINLNSTLQLVPD